MSLLGLCFGDAFTRATAHWTEVKPVEAVAALDQGAHSRPIDLLTAQHDVIFFSALVISVLVLVLGLVRVCVRLHVAVGGGSKGW